MDNIEALDTLFSNAQTQLKELREAYQNDEYYYNEEEKYINPQEIIDTVIDVGYNQNFCYQNGEFIYDNFEQQVPDSYDIPETNLDFGKLLNIFSAIFNSHDFCVVDGEIQYSY